MKATAILVQYCLLGVFSCVSLVAFAELTFQPVFEGLRFKAPVLLTHAGDGRNRLSVVEQGGKIHVFDNQPNTSSSQIFFDIERHSTSEFLTGGEQGLLGLAFDPDFKNNGYFYVNYTASKPRRTVVSRFKAAGEASLNVQAESETILIEVEQDFANHNGGMISFGPDGYLYIGMGDGGSGGDPNHRAQDGQSLLGKMLRIRADGSVPSDNPFVANKTMRPEIWALGLRNPWRFSFDRSTGALWVGDVGQNKVEEVDIVVKGGNYGWRWYEGFEPYNIDKATAKPSLITPVFTYTRDLGRSITGGYVYRGDDYPNLQGLYFFADFVSGQTWSLPVGSSTARPLARLNNPASFGEDEAGELYVVSYSGGIFQIVDR